LHFLRCPLPAPDGPCELTRPLGEDGIDNNNYYNNDKYAGRIDSVRMILDSLN